MSPVTDIVPLEGGAGAALAMRLAAERRAGAARLTYRDRLATLEALAEALLSRDVNHADRLVAADCRSWRPSCAPPRSSPCWHANCPRQGSRALRPGGRSQGASSRAAGNRLPLDCGNVPLLGLFSWALSVLVGNVNVIRLSSRQDDLLSPILERLAALSAAGRNWRPRLSSSASIATSAPRTRP